MPRYRGKNDLQEQPTQFQRFVQRGEGDDEIIIKNGDGTILTTILVTIKRTVGEQEECKHNDWIKTGVHREGFGELVHCGKCGKPAWSQ